MKQSPVIMKVLRDPIGAVSLAYIIVVFFIALFASKLAPDFSENANQMHVSIHSKPPGFTTKLLIIPSQDGSVLEEIPVVATRWEETQLFYQTQAMGKDYEVPLDRNNFPLEMTPSQIEQEYVVERTFYWGTDKFGRDLLSRMIFGSRISLSIGFIAVFISLFIGVLLGGLAGFLGGKTDQVMVWLINVMWSIPSLLMVIAITLALGKGYWQVFIAVGLTMWVDVARLVRGQVISIKEQPYIQAAHILSFSSISIFFKHIFPLLIPALIVISTANFASAILIESGLSFLGIGAQPPIPSWGGMIKDHFRYILLGKAYLAVIPGVAIMSLVLAFMLLGNSLRDAMDVKNYSH
ncbi:MAG: ABC transporter permease [Flavobacteriaceae bacterium]